MSQNARNLATSPQVRIFQTLVRFLHTQVRGSQRRDSARPSRGQPSPAVPDEGQYGQDHQQTEDPTHDGTTFQPRHPMVAPVIVGVPLMIHPILSIR
jgi:hypothetical protein